jgi:hypothetical protein
VSREREENGRTIVRLRCLNDNLELELASGVRLEVTGKARAEPLDEDGVVDLAPGRMVERRFALPAGFHEGDAAFGVRFTDADANRRLTRRRFLTHEAERRR